MKRIGVKLLGSTIEPFALIVHPGVTAGEILTSLNLTDVVLAIPPAPPRRFGSAEQVYEELLDGDFLFAVGKRSPTLSPEESAEQLQTFIEEDHPTKTIDSEEARRDLMSLLEVDDEEPIP